MHIQFLVDLSEHTPKEWQQAVATALERVVRRIPLRNEISLYRVADAAHPLFRGVRRTDSRLPRLFSQLRAAEPCGNRAVELLTGLLEIAEQRIVIVLACNLPTAPRPLLLAASSLARRGGYVNTLCLAGNLQTSEALSALAESGRGAAEYVYDSLADVLDVSLARVLPNLDETAPATVRDELDALCESLEAGSTFTVRRSSLERLAAETIPHPQDGITEQGPSAKAHGTPFIVVEGHAARFPVTSMETVLGRHDDFFNVTPDVDLGAFDEQRSVSRLHASVTWSGGCFTVVDLDSTNGTYVPGREQPLPHRLPYAVPAGARIRVGTVDLRLVLEPARAFQA